MLILLALLASRLALAGTSPIGNIFVNLSQTHRQSDLLFGVFFEEVCYLIVWKFVHARPKIL